MISNKNNNKIKLKIKQSYQLLKIKNLQAPFKPREKLLAQGSASLKLEELIAIILNIGTKKEDVKSMAARLLQEYGLKGIAYNTQAQQIQQDYDIPLYQACRLTACFELGRRFYQDQSGYGKIIRSPQQAFTVLKDMQNLKKEQIRALYLDNNYRLIHDEIISLGTIDAALLQIRDIFIPGLQRNASAVIIAHNHPSTNLKFSSSDQKITKKLIKAGNILGISLLDHILISSQGFKSSLNEVKI